MNRLLMMAAAVLISAAESGSGLAAENDIQAQEQTFERAMETPGNFGQDLENPRVITISPRTEQAAHKAVPVTENVKGTVTLVGDNVIRLVELDTGIEREINVTDTQEKALTTGFAIKARVKDGRLVSYTEIGVPPHVEDIVYSSENLPTDNVLEDYYNTEEFLN